MLSQSFNRFHRINVDMMMTQTEMIDESMGHKNFGEDGPHYLRLDCWGHTSHHMICTPFTSHQL